MTHQSNHFLNNMKALQWNPLLLNIRDHFIDGKHIFDMLNININMEKLYSWLRLKWAEIRAPSPPVIILYSTNILLQSSRREDDFALNSRKCIFRKVDAKYTVCILVQQLITFDSLPLGMFLQQKSFIK